jgi:hypothetical protein
VFAGALFGPAALAAEPKAGALKQVSQQQQQQQQPVRRPTAVFFLRNTNSALPDAPNKPKPAGTYSKTLTFTLSTTSPAPPPPPAEAFDTAHAGMHDGGELHRATGNGKAGERAFRSRMGHLMSARKGGENDVAVEGITLVHEGFERD